MDEVERIRKLFRDLTPILNERQIRLWAAAEAELLGRGGVAIVTRATGLRHKRIVERRRDLFVQREMPPSEARRVRRPGAGRKRIEAQGSGMVGQSFGAPD
jgi:hypothetical protein